MADVYSETIKKMSDYITSRLVGSDPSMKRLFRDTNPSQLIIVGTLANIVENKGTKKSSVQENSLKLKFKTDVMRTYRVSVYYSVYVSTPLSEEERIEHPNINKAWDRVDFFDEFDMYPGDKCVLLFNNDVNYSDYSAFIDMQDSIVDGHHQISLCLENNSVSNHPDHYLFNVNISIDVLKKDMCPYHYEYYYEKLKQHFDHDFRTINCTASFNDSNTILSTSPIPEFDQYKEKLKDSDQDFSFDFDRLSTPNYLNDLQKYGNILENYLSNYSELDPPSDKREEFDISFNNFKKIVDCYNLGVQVLSSNEDAERSFMLMNRTFLESSSHKSWRLFQIIYIVSRISSVINKTDLDTCDVIHIPTGGGKTEAYLGLTIFLMFYSRLIGYVSGTVSIVKFPLRMLSIQQIERVASKIIIAEKIRKDENILGSPFSASFFVGNSMEYPNHTSDAIKTISSASIPLQGKIIKKCPLCDGDIVLNVTKYNSVVHHCTRCDTDHFLYYTDEEIYRYLPSVIISTVDKFSTISVQRRVKCIFGCKLVECSKGHGYFPAGDTCAVCDASRGTFVDMAKITSPMIVVQDELHLIRESLGSINAHFESFCEELQYELTRTRPIRVALTATITGCAEQIDQLYNRHSCIFPGPNPYSVINRGNYYDPFFELEYDDGCPKLHRRIIGLKPNGRDNQYATNLTIKYVREFVKDLINGDIQYDSSYGMDEKTRLSVAKKIISMLTYHNKKSDVHSTSHFIDPVLSDESGYTYVSKRTLTGESNVDEIRDIIDSVKNFETSPDSIIHITSATSVVSHGVDLEQWNFMEFQGIPNNTAEYIQARSRVGRKYSGLIFIWFYPNRVRDVSFYHNFQEFHQIIDHKVEPVSINKWTKLSFMETCTSLFFGSILNYLSAKHTRQIYTRKHFVELFSSNSTYKDEILQFLHKVYHTDSSSDGADYIRKILDKEVEQRIKSILDSASDGKNVGFFPRILMDQKEKYYGIQSGMRGIQEIVSFNIEDQSFNFIKRLKK